MQLAQLEAIVATIIVTFFAAVLAILMTQSYLKNRKRSHMFWSLGLWVFVLSAFLEILFALNIYSAILMAAYLYSVVILVQLLSLGSIQLISSKRIINSYTIFTAIVAVVALISVIVGPIKNLIVNYIVFGQPTLFIVVASSLAVFPAAVVLIWVAAIGYKHTRSNKMLGIIAGVFIISIAGTLYIVYFPSVLYIAELLGVFLLFYGFYSPPRKRVK